MSQRFQSYFQQLQLAVVCLSMTLLSMYFQAHPHAFASAFSPWLLSHTFVSSSLPWFLLVICPPTPQVSSLCNLYHIYYCLIQPEHTLGGVGVEWLPLLPCSFHTQHPSFEWNGMKISYHDYRDLKLSWLSELTRYC